MAFSNQRIGFRDAFITVIASLAALLLFPAHLFRRRSPMAKPDKRFDERDTVFARFALKKNTPHYEDYYSRRSDLKRTDDRIRSLPPLFKSGGRYYQEDICNQADRYFERINDIAINPSIVARWKTEIKVSTDPQAVIRKMLHSLGAVAAGFSPAIEEFVYSHQGRQDENYGKKIDHYHPSVIVFLVEMDINEMQHAPFAETARETAYQYYRAAVIAKTVEATLKASGYDARAQYDAHYDFILPPLAVNAGLGELGRNNILIADRYGSRVRIGAVSTDFPLEYDSPVYLGADEFCKICKKCAENCPPKALNDGDKQSVNGVMKWQTGTEQCYAYWRSIGSDCGICMAVCPFSHRNNWLHNLVRWAIPLNPWIRHIALWFDDRIYGRKWKNLEKINVVV